MGIGRRADDDSVDVLCRGDRVNRADVTTILTGNLASAAAGIASDTATSLAPGFAVTAFACTFPMRPAPRSPNLIVMFPPTADVRSLMPSGPANRKLGGDHLARIHPPLGVQRCFHGPHHLQRNRVLASRH
jgi:hypothetical protein